MVEHLLSVLGTDSRTLPARVCGLLAQRNIPVSSVQMAKPVGSQHWWIQLVVCVDSTTEVQLVVNRLNRLVDVVKVSDDGPVDAHPWIGNIAQSARSGDLASVCLNA